MKLHALDLGDPPERWEALGFVVVDGTVCVGGVSLRLGAPGTGIVGWELGSGDAQARAEVVHPNGAVGIDHVVMLSGDFDRAAAELERRGLALRRVRDAGGFRQGFRRVGPAILELVEATGEPPQPRFWGLVVTVSDLDALAERLGSLLGRIKPAVQPGRRIATLRESAGLGEAVAFMDPES